MLFAEWMDENRIEPKDVVEEVAKHDLETSLDMVYKVRGSKRRFSPEINRVIVEWSKRMVPQEDRATEDWLKRTVSWEELNFPEEFQKASGE